MNQNLTELIVILDRSGSMSTIEAATISGFNEWLATQKRLPGEARLTLVQFDHEYQTVHAGRNVKEIEPLTSATFQPRGSTALNDAIGRTIDEVGARLAATPEIDRPGRVAVLIVTDGGENASVKYSGDAVTRMIRTQTDIYKWDFAYLGANQDAIKTGMKLGIAAGKSMTYSANVTATANAWGANAVYTSALRSAATPEAMSAVNYSAEDRQKAVTGEQK